MAKAFPLLKLFMLCTGWGAVSTILKSLLRPGLEPDTSSTRSWCSTTGIYSKYIEPQEVYNYQSIYVHLLDSIDSSRFTNLKSGKESIMRATYSLATQNIFFLYFISLFLFIYLKESCPFYISVHIFLYISIYFEFFLIYIFFYL